MKPIIAISMGDYNGIGPEAALKALTVIDYTESIPLWIGSASVLRYYCSQLPASIEISEIDEPGSVSEGCINILNPYSGNEFIPEPGTITAGAGLAAMQAVERGIETCLAGKSHALVTSPISKEAISMAGFSVPGHTEFLAQKTSAGHVAMMLVSSELRVALATIHIPVKQITESLSETSIVKTAGIVHQSLIKNFGIESPKIALLGLNPHAGDGGVLGSEEHDIIEPAIRQLNKNSIPAEGPFAADGYFGNRLYKAFDATLAMYHDQGLIPFKTLSFGHGVNFTAGLPIIRTSPDHGTAFSIAGKNQADHRSFLEAYRLAVSMAKSGLIKTQ